MIILGLKIAVVVVMAGCLTYIAVHTRLTRGAVWHDSIGKTVIIPVFFMMGEAVPFLLAAFFHLSTLGNRIGSWVFIVSLFLGGVAMFWRAYVFIRDNPLKRKVKP